MDDRQNNIADMNRLMTMPWRKMMAVVFRWLDGKDARRRDLALLIFRRNAQLAARWLAGELLAPKKRLEQRLQILDALDLLDSPMPAEVFFDLSFAAHRFGFVVAARIARLLQAGARAAAGPSNGRAN